MVDEFHAVNPADVAPQAFESSRGIGCLTEFPQNGTVKDVAHKGGFPGAAYSGHHGQHTQREFHIDVFEVVFACSFHFDVAAPFASF